MRPLYLVSAVAASLGLASAITAPNTSPAAVTLAGAITPVVAPRWGRACRTDLDCSLNGVCSLGSGVCACDPGFVGVACEMFDFLPSPVGAAYDAPDAAAAAAAATSSWGGTSVYDPKSGLWHGYFSEFYGGCGVLSWQSQSQIVHAVAPSPLGRFEKVGIAIGAQAHNAEARRDPVSGEWLLFHIGDGARAGTSGRGIQCSNGTTGSCVQGPDCPAFRPFPWRCCTNQTLHFPKANATPGRAVLHHGPGPDGPWKPIDPRLPLANLSPSYCRDNPTAYIAPNGTIYVVAVCHLPGGGGGGGSRTSKALAPGLPKADASASFHATVTPIQEGLPSVLMLWRGTAWDGGFEQIGNVTRSNGPGEPQWSWVDPTLWLDRRGNIHIVANMGYTGYNCTPVGAHAFSADGRTFHSFSEGSDPTKIHPIYNGTTEFEGESTPRWLHLERPKIVIDPGTGQPTALYVSVGSHCPDLEHRPPYTDRSWTLARPIRTSGTQHGAEAMALNWPHTALRKD